MKPIYLYEFVAILFLAAGAGMMLDFLIIGPKPGKIPGHAIPSGVTNLDTNVASWIWTNNEHSFSIPHPASLAEYFGTNGPSFELADGQDSFPVLDATNLPELLIGETMVPIYHFTDAQWAVLTNAYPDRISYQGSARFYATNDWAKAHAIPPNQP